MTPAKARERLGVKDTENAAVSPDEVEQRMQAEQIQNPGQGVSFLAVVIATAGLLLLMALAIVWAAKRKGRNE